MLGLAAACFPDRDNDHYGANHNQTIATDGIPDLLYEAKIGTDYIIQAYEKADSVADMITSIGNFSSDHSWWGSPEYQDGKSQNRGGPIREARNEVGANILGDFSAGLAFVGKLYKPYDQQYVEKCLLVSQKLYEYAKVHQITTESPAYNGNATVNDELAFAALGLLWATEDSKYLQDLAFD